MFALSAGLIVSSSASTCSRFSGSTFRCLVCMYGGRGLLPRRRASSRIVRKHRAEQLECCKREANCVGFELPLLLASVSEVAIGHVLGALTVAAGRLAALPEEEVPGGPLRFG